MPIKKVEVKYCPDSSLGVVYHPRVWRNVKPGMVYVDVGAYCGGTVSKTLYYYPHLKVVAIEPIPKRIMNMFETHPEIIPNTTFINKGCWSERRRQPLYLREGKLSGSTMFQEQTIHLHKEETYVNVDTLDQLLCEAGIEKVNLLKIDTEGAEAHVLTGFTKHSSDTQFHIEYHHNLGPILEALSEKPIAEIVIYVGKGGFGGSIIGVFDDG
jgi:FkbM family methyltransferase